MTALALILAPVLVMHVKASQSPLPGCNAETTRASVADGIDTIPAFAGRNARMLGLEDVASRGAKGNRRLRACQAWLITDHGAGTLEYSIRDSDKRDSRFAIRVELFQGGWRDLLIEQAAFGD